jgi:hypothetical protein
MRTRLRTTVTLLALLGVWFLAGYELPARAVDDFDRHPPGWEAALAAERETPWRAWTGWRPLDRLLHEGEEAARFWRRLLGPI